MADIFSKQKRSEVMSLIRATNTKPEIALRKIISSALYSRGFRYRLNYSKVPGKPDIVFINLKIAVFVDGSFWHGYRYQQGQSLSKEYWLPKILRNMQRDKEVNRTLRKMGWTVVRIWEHEINRNPKRALRIVSKSLNKKAQQLLQKN